MNYLLQIVAEPNGQMIALAIVGTITMSVWILREPDIQYLNNKAGEFGVDMRTIEIELNESKSNECTIDE